MMIMVDEDRLRRLLYGILHGDEKHRQWLKDKCEEIINECKKHP